MRLADDGRGRVPFALVGVLLLLSSTAYASTLSTHGVRIDRDVDVAMDRATAASETALRSAVSRAAQDAARTPVVDPAKSQWGDVLRDGEPFRDALRVRIYVAARDGFRRASYSRGDVTARASLPATPTPSALERAVERISLTSAENGTALRVTLRNVSVTARSGGRVVARETANRTVTVATPVLALHDRTVAFERSLDRGPFAGDGLGRRVTARLYPIAWARGYAQWSGQPISNVVGTRHVDITTNGALLELQRAQYGRADPTARRAHGRALHRFSRAELRAATSTPATSFGSSLTPDPSSFDPNDAPSAVPRLAPDEAPSLETTRTIGVNGSADHAFVSLVEGANGRSLEAVLNDAYEVDVRLRTTTTLLESGTWPHPRPPSSDAVLVNETIHPSATVEAGTATVPRTRANWTRFREATRHVTVRHQLEWTWAAEDGPTRTSATVVERYAVGVAVDGRPAPLDGVPQRPVTPRFERGGPLDGPNLADVPEQTDSFLAERGGVDSLVERRVVEGRDSLESNGTLSGDRPDGLTEWVRRDLLTLHETVRDQSVTVEMGEVASASANPADRLVESLATRRAALVDAPARYDGAAGRARVAARAAYLDRIRGRLNQRANESRRVNDALAQTLVDEGYDIDGRVGITHPSRVTEPPLPTGPTASAVPTGPLGGEDVFVPQGGPAYLDVEGVPGADVAWTRQVDTVYPVRTRNRNLFTVPYGDAASSVVDSTMPAEAVRLQTAAVTLRAAENAAGPDTPTLRERRDHLDGEVRDALLAVGTETQATLARETSLRGAERRRVVDRAFGRWNRTSARALAVTNGSFVPAVVDEAGVEGERAERLATHLRVTVADVRANPEYGIETEPVNSTASAVRRLSTTATTEAFGAATDAGFDRLETRVEGSAVVLPAGLPLVPTPTNWYATVNVWHVDVRGFYPRFAVRTQRGTPGNTLTYVRDDGTATLDVDDDGHAEELGRASRITFSVRTVVVVAVPPGRTGVGDVDGNANETSPGWGTTRVGVR